MIIRKVPALLMAAVLNEFTDTDFLTEEELLYRQEEERRLRYQAFADGMKAKLQEAIRQPVPVRSEWADRFDASRIVPQVLSLATPECGSEGD